MSLPSYVFKRLRFLGNKDLSQLGALFFLAIWHGLFSGILMEHWPAFPGTATCLLYPSCAPVGYFVAFVFEFFCMMAENGIKVGFGSFFFHGGFSSGPFLT
jgi:hypothetical protein